MIRYLLIVLLIGSVLLFSCNRQQGSVPHCNHSFDPETWDSCNQVVFDFNNYNINILNYNELPYLEGKSSVRKKEYFDSDSIPLHSFKGRLNYHPIFLIQYSFQLLDVYNSIKDNSSLMMVEKIAHKLYDLALPLDSALFFPYAFDFALHGCEEETMKAPWYSGMTQGQALSLFVRLYELTGDEFYLTQSHKIFNSFTRLKGEGHQPWVTCIDKYQNIWFEEYPRELPCFTLNGKIFAIFGLYDYFRLTQNNTAKKLVQGGITTIEKNIHKYRVQDDVSWYCLKHQKMELAQNFGYHLVHTEQLNYLYQMTGNDYFKEMSENLASDTENMPDEKKVKKKKK